MPFPSPLNEPILRDDLPRYPQLVQMLRVTAATVAGPAGFAQVAGSSVLGPTLYVAFTQQMRDDGSLLPRDREPCLVDDVNGVGLTSGFYLGRLVGSFNSLPVYEVCQKAVVGGSTDFNGARADVGISTPTFTVHNNVKTYITFDNLLYDNGSPAYYSNVPGYTAFTAPSTGYYNFGVFLAWSSGGPVAVTLEDPGPSVLFAADKRTSTGDVYQCIGTEFYMSDNTMTVAVSVTQTTGSDQNVSGAFWINQIH